MWQTGKNGDTEIYICRDEGVRFEIYKSPQKLELIVRGSPENSIYYFNFTGRGARDQNNNYIDDKLVEEKVKLMPEKDTLPADITKVMLAVKAKPKELPIEPV